MTSVTCRRQGARFQLRDQNGKAVSLAEFRARKPFFYFCPKDETLPVRRRPAAFVTATKISSRPEPR